MQSGSCDNKANLVPSTPTGAACHLLKLRSSQLPPATSCTSVGSTHHDCPGRKIDARGHGGSRENRVEKSRAHKLFDGQFPGGNVSGVMRSHTASNNRVPVTMTPGFRVFLDEFLHEFAAGILTSYIRISSHERGLGGSLIASTAGRKKNNGGE